MSRRPLTEENLEKKRALSLDAVERPSFGAELEESGCGDSSSGGGAVLPSNRDLEAGRVHVEAWFRHARHVITYGP